MISYHKIADAINYYKFHGYKFIDVPWAVPLAALAPTMPKDAATFEIPSGLLVASGEQSFIHLMQQKKLLPGNRYCCATPCFREEKQYNEYTRNYFFKLELIHVLENESDTIYKKNLIYDMAYHACYHMNLSFPCAMIPMLGKGDVDNYIDIIAIHNGVELGSYGARFKSGMSWVYGTGLAEPRMSLCEASYKSLFEASQEAMNTDIE